MIPVTAGLSTPPRVVVVPMKTQLVERAGAALGVQALPAASRGVGMRVHPLAIRRSGVVLHAASLRYSLPRPATGLLAVLCHDPHPTPALPISMARLFG